MTNEPLDREAWGHSENEHGEAESLALHSSTVAARCEEFAKFFDCDDEGRTCGAFHDLGKLGPPMQRRIKQGKGRSIDHWSFGAHRAFVKYQANGIAAAMAILSHHTGLERLSADRKFWMELGQLDPWQKQIEANNCTLAKVPPEEADAWLASNDIDLPDSFQSICPWEQISLKNSASVMADVRMLFSALVDADFLETEAHFKSPVLGERYERPRPPEVQSERALALVLRYIDRCRHRTNATESVIRMRDDLLAACRSAANEPQGIFTLSAPTGTGKTLAMLAFALEHAVRHSLRRVVLVVPYLSIIEQTARIYREIFEAKDSGFGPHYILEHHSLTRGPSDEKDGDENERLATARLMTENWDSPIIITTSVQFFESLFSNRSSACRKLHRLARSVVLFDEAQTFPKELAIPTLATLGRMAERYGCTTVFATATQPAFTHFDSKVKEIGGPGWQPHEIVPSELNLFDRAKRTTVHWPQKNERTTWTELSERLSRHDHEKVLCIVNLKQHAMQLVELMRDRVDEAGMFHLSTNLCPAHREKVLAAVRRHLAEEADKPCRLIATQCVEAGVDLDFPIVYRAMGPLDAIAQAAGRCNRNGRQDRGDVHVFRPDTSSDEAAGKTLYPPGGYQQAAMRTEGLLSLGNIDIDDPQAFAKYYSGLYKLSDFTKLDIIEEMKNLDFEKVANLYRLIDNRAVNLIVPYDRELFGSLRKQAFESGLSGEWMRRARPLTVAVYDNPRNPLSDATDPVPLSNSGGHRRSADGDFSDEWFMLRESDADYYDDVLGLKAIPAGGGWIA